MEASVSDRDHSWRADLLGLLAVFALFLGVRFGARAMGVALGGPLATVVALGGVLIVRRLEGASPGLGLGRPRSWSRALVTFLLAFAITAAAGILLMAYLQGIFGAPESSGRFDYLRGNLPALALSVVGIAWFAAAFGEEVLFRGFAMPRIAALLGGGDGAWVAAVLAQAALFAVLHSGVVGAIVSGVIGLGYGLLFWRGGRNLWPLILAHAIPDTISFIGIYQAG